jgi:hypothetical protein
MKKIAVIAVIVSLVSATGSFAGIRESAARAAAEQAASPASLSNPYLWPSVGLMSGGVSMVLLAFLNPSDLDCSTTTGNNFNVGVNCGTKANKGLLFAGVGVAAIGGFLFWKGEQTKNSRSVTFVAPVNGGVEIGHRVRF